MFSLLPHVFPNPSSRVSHLIHSFINFFCGLAFSFFGMVSIFSLFFFFKKYYFMPPPFSLYVHVQALMMASQEGRTSTVQVILGAGAGMEAKDKVRDSKRGKVYL